MLVDTSVVIAYLTGTEQTSNLATELFDRFVATGRNPAFLSMITVEEILVRPFRAGPAAVARAEGFLRHFADIGLIAVDYEVAREAARIRATAGLPTPDAIVLASALVGGVDVLVTNDRVWKARAASIAPGLGLCLFADLVPSQRSTGRRAAAGSLRAKVRKQRS
jgi:predicted nucleic acid-binding protein